MKNPWGTRWVARALLATVCLLLLAGVSCSDDDAADGEETVQTPLSPDDTSAPMVLSDLVDVGAHECADVEGDLTVSAQSITEPPVPVPGLDLLSARSTLDDDFLIVTFEVAASPDPASRPEFVFFVGLIDDLNGFEVKATYVEDGWIAQVATRGAGENPTRPIPNARVETEGASVTLTVPRIDVPSVGPNQPVAYGSSGAVVDDTGAYLDAAGEPVDGVGQAARAFEECLSFGQ